MRLVVEKGCFSYGSHEVLRDVSFQAEPGEVTAVLGPNGAGKTTLLRCMMGMERWSSGRSLLDGENIRSMPARRVWSRISYVPQAKAAAVSFTALESVLLGRSSRLGIFSAPGAEDVEKAEAVLESLKIAHLAKKSCARMSGGEQQMVLIARALASDPKILVLDEPESNLDFKNQLIVLDTLSELARSGMACIFNTHYPAHAMQRAEKALILKKGGSYLFGAADRVITEENIESAFGVKTVIGEIETPGNILKSVVPLEISGSHPQLEEERAGGRRSIAAVTIILNDNGPAEKINEILHAYRTYVVGRMGMPYRQCGLYIINVTLDAPENIITGLTHKINLLPGASIKVTFAKGEFQEE